MMTKAFLLVETSVGRTRDVFDALKGIDGVESADVVTGPYDIIATLRGKDVSAAGTLVTEKVGPIVGVVRTVTNFAIPNGR
jgi:DNA-binding Lrp family transcriptional regulator